jgi:predicted MFS family arabinose efflux permease
VPARLTRHRAAGRHHTVDSTAPREPGMSRGLIAVFALATGLAVASNYLAQPLLATIRHDLHVSSSVAGFIVTVAQTGYALGLVLLLPLGDLLERRRLITTLAALTAVGLAAAGFAPSIGLLMGATGLVALTSVLAQILVPFAASLTPPARRGQVVGSVMSGLLVGILMARTVAGLVAQIAGWRTVYWVAAACMFTLAVVLHRQLPSYREHLALPYPRLLLSVVAIARREPVLRRRAVYGAFAFADFSVLWTTLAFLLAGPRYHYGEAVIGLFGLAGAAGALAASPIGRLNDKGWTVPLTGLMSVLLSLSFLLIWLGRTSLVSLIAGVVVVDMASQNLHITNQSQIYRLHPDERSRITAFYMTCCFAGAAIGSSSAASAYGASGWKGVCILGAGFGFASLLWWLVDLVRARLRDERATEPGTAE